MNKLLFIMFCFTILKSKGQQVQIVIHNDLIETTNKNTVSKLAYNELYNAKLKDIKDARERVAEYMGVVNEVQNKIFNSLSNINDALKNGKALYYSAQRITSIFLVLRKTTSVAVNNPSAIILVSRESEWVLTRVTNLTNYIETTVNSSDEKTLIDQATRDKIISHIYNEVNVIYNLCMHIYTTCKAANIQDAVNTIIPYKTYINVDKLLINNIMYRYKF